jgi:hypothetical protein
MVVLITSKDPVTSTPNPGVKPRAIVGLSAASVIFCRCQTPSSGSGWVMSNRIALAESPKRHAPGPGGAIADPPTGRLGLVQPAQPASARARAGANASASASAAATTRARAAVTSRGSW